MKGADIGPARGLFFSVLGAVRFVIGHVSFGSLFFSFHLALVPVVSVSLFACINKC